MGKIVDRRDISEITVQLRKEGRKIVFTNGCFDLIHAGHVRYLREAKGFGDVLIIGLNSDRSVSSIKSDRPVVPQTERSEVIASLEMVDYVVIFDEETPYELIRAVRPDVLVKGGDWKKEDIVGSDIVKEVYSLTYHRGHSTSDIIKKIQSL